MIDRMGEHHLSGKYSLVALALVCVAENLVIRVPNQLSLLFLVQIHFLS